MRDTMDMFDVRTQDKIYELKKLKKMNKRLYMYMKTLYQKKLKINMELYFLATWNSTAGGLLIRQEI